MVILFTVLIIVSVETCSGKSSVGAFMGRGFCSVLKVGQFDQITSILLESRVYILEIVFLTHRYVFFKWFAYWFDFILKRTERSQTKKN